jgi:hypothetical protein
VSDGGKAEESDEEADTSLLPSEERKVPGYTYDPTDIRSYYYPRRLATRAVHGCYAWQVNIRRIINNCKVHI